MGGVTFPMTGRIPPIARPQWSPPLMGGVTHPLRDAAAVPRPAAMEPAADGRGDLLPVLRHRVHVVAAMEPAADGRGDWSSSSRRRTEIPGAAMEPAADGRGDLDPRPAFVLGHDAAMEPAADGRGDPTRCSPPSR